MFLSDKPLKDLKFALRLSEGSLPCVPVAEAIQDDTDIHITEIDHGPRTQQVCVMMVQKKEREATLVIVSFEEMVAASEKLHTSLNCCRDLDV
jgi:hypothetical protein